MREHLNLLNLESCLFLCSYSKFLCEFTYIYLTSEAPCILYLLVVSNNLIISGATADVSNGVIYASLIQLASSILLLVFVKFVDDNFNYLNKK